MNNFDRDADRLLTFKQLLWLIPIVLTLHNIEEALTMPRWVMANLPLIKENLPITIDLQFSPAQLLFSLLIATVVPVVATMVCINGERRSVKLHLLFLLQAIVLLNVFIPHIAASIRMRQYNPGVVTAVCVNLPFSLYFFRRAFLERYLASREFVSLFILALLVYGPVAWALHFGGELFAKML
jgi:Protein of unknown function with HXXEE motif